MARAEVCLSMSQWQCPSAVSAAAAAVGSAPVSGRGHHGRVAYLFPAAAAADGQRSGGGRASGTQSHEVVAVARSLCAAVLKQRPDRRWRYREWEGGREREREREREQALSVHESIEASLADEERKEAERGRGRESHAEMA